MDYKYSCEYAKSSRSICKKCHTPIGQDSLRIAIMVQSKAFDGKIPNWYHYKCFFEKNKIESSSLIKNFGSIRIEDQQKIEDMILDPFGGNDAKKSWKLSKLKTNHAKECVYCKSVIIRGSIFTQNKSRTIELYHLACFIVKNPEADFPWIVKTSALSKDDKDDAMEEYEKALE